MPSKITRWCVERGLIDWTEEANQRALSRAAKANALHVLRDLCSIFQDQFPEGVDIWGLEWRTALTHAVLEKHQEAAMLLAEEYEASLTRYYSGVNALEAAERNQQEELKRALLKGRRVHLNWQRISESSRQVLRESLQEPSCPTQVLIRECNARDQTVFNHVQANTSLISLKLENPSEESYINGLNLFKTKTNLFQFGIYSFEFDNKSRNALVQALTDSKKNHLFDCVELQLQARCYIVHRFTRILPPNHSHIDCTQSQLHQTLYSRFVQCGSYHYRQSKNTWRSSSTTKLSIRCQSHHPGSFRQCIVFAINTSLS